MEVGKWQMGGVEGARAFGRGRLVLISRKKRVENRE
jgi:hypothetical protein